MDDKIIYIILYNIHYTLYNVYSTLYNIYIHIYRHIKCNSVAEYISDQPIPGICLAEYTRITVYPVNIIRLYCIHCTEVLPVADTSGGEGGQSQAKSLQCSSKKQQ